MKWFVSITLLTKLTLLLASDTIRFAPLPMQKAETVIQQYTPFLKHLEEETGTAFEISYSPNYDTLIEKFVRGEIDMAYLGPLPYVKLHRQFPYAKPLVRFLNSDGEADYTCCLIARSDSGISPLYLSQAKRVALTQPSSTCGYLITEKILRKHDLSLSNTMFYSYTGSHSNSALSVILGNADIGGLKTSIAKRYLFHGITILEESDPIPGFALIYNSKTMDSHQADLIRDSLLSKQSQTEESVKQWGKQLQYGVVPASHSDYAYIIKALITIMIPEEQ